MTSQRGPSQPLGRRVHTADDLLDQARRRGFQVTRRLLLDWTEQGLLDRPQRQGLGRGKGSRALWSHAQAELWLTLLSHHQHGGVRTIRGLCDVPVAQWLYYGDGSGVPLEQVKRAVATWIAAYQRTPYGTTLSTARDLVERTADPVARREDIEALTQALVGVLMSGRSADAKRLHEQAAALIPPCDTALHLARARAAPDRLPGRTLEGLILARLTAMDEFTRLPDALWAWARVFVLCGGSTQRPAHRRPSPSSSSAVSFPATPVSAVSAAFPASRGSSASSPRPQGEALVFRQVIAPADMETLRVSVCLEVLTLLGLGWIEPALGHVSAPLRPEAWLRGDVHATIDVRTVDVSGSARQRVRRPTLHIRVTIASPAHEASAESPTG